MPSTLPPWRIRLIRTLLGGCALAIGVLLAWAGYFHQLPKHRQVAAWERVPCQILSWGVTVTHGSAGSRVQPGMSFEYRWGDRTYRSSNYDEATDWVIDLRDFEAEGAAARRGPAFCRVNPANPSQASFRAARLWFPSSLIGGGGLLAVVSAGFLLRTWLPSRRTLDPNLFQRQAGSAILAGLAALLLGLGSYQLWRFAPHEALRQQLVRHRLIEVPVRVEATGIEETRGTGRNSHRIYHQAHLVYSYEHDGRRWHSDRWSFQAKHSSGSKDQLRALLDRYPRGSELRGWMDPEKPWYSTLNPGLHWGLLWNLIPLACLSAGVWLLGTLRPRR